MNRIHLRHLLPALLLLASHLGWSQGATTAAMSGTITDGKGGALPGATVVAVHTPTNTTYGAGTNADGRFNIQNMRVGGPYTIKITFVGYQDVNRSGINLTLAENFRLDAKMSEASTALNEVVVTGRQNPVINSDRTGAATTVQREQIERLPTINRSFDDFTRLTPQANGQSFGGRSSGYNNITIDGAIFNNSFGLTSTLGGLTNSQPISIDAIDQIQVSIAPYDVRQGSFTGAGINAVTRSGTNKFSGSLYGFYRDQALVGTKVGDVDSDFPTFNLKNFGARVGGPIIKDKLFFFLNAEQETRTDPGTVFQANRPSLPAPGGNSLTSAASARDLGALSNFLVTKYGYDPGPYEGYSLRTYSRKATAKIDWNISANHRFNIKYNYLRSYQDKVGSTSGAVGSSRAPSQFGLPFFSSYYTQNSDLQSVIGELNSTFGTRFSNNMTIGYTAQRDKRESPAGGSFPLVDIGNATARTPAGGTINATGNLTSFGYEPFSAFNLLDADTYQFGDNFTAFLGKHNVTLGTYNELYKFRNGFAPTYYGNYQFNGLDDFYASARTPEAPFGYTRDANGNPVPQSFTTPTNGQPVPATGVTLGLPQSYALQYSALPGGFPYAETKAAQLGLYIQDEYSPIPNLKVIVGLRGDMPIIYSDIERNNVVSGGFNAKNGVTYPGLTFRNNVQLETDRLPKTQVLFSPRIGANWDVNDDKRTQVRGGTGIFTGRVPFVWISNQASNNGVQFGSFVRTGTNVGGVNNNVFSPSVDTYRPEGAAPNTSYNLAVTDKDFKFPQVWRSNFAVDQEIFGGIVATLEALYTKDLNAVYVENVALPNAVGRAVGADTRPIFYTFGAPLTGANAGLVSRTANTTLFTGNTVANPTISNAILMRNTNKGYSYSITGQLQKSFRNGLYASAAYTYTDSRSVNDGGSIAQSIWRDRQISGDPNADVLSYSQFLQQHRVIASLSYRREYLGHLGSTFSLFYEGAPAGRFSYTYAGDMNGDGSGGSGNDLMYVPRNQREILLRDITKTAVQGGGIYTAAQQWTDLNNYIEQDDYLKTRRGEYAERNGAVRPWQHRVDVRLLQDLFTNLGNGSKNSLQLSIDVFNIGNLLSSKWGVFQTANRAALLRFEGYTAAGQPAFTFPTATATSADPLTSTFRDETNGISSRWQAQIGVRYIFN